MRKISGMNEEDMGCELMDANEGKKWKWQQQKRGKHIAVAGYLEGKLMDALHQQVKLIKS